MQTGNFQELLTKYINGSLSAEEQEQLHAALSKEADSEALQEAMAEMLQQTPPDTNYDKQYWDDTIQQITGVDRVIAISEAPTKSVKQRPVHRIHFLKTSWFRYAAAILLLVGIGATFRFVYRKNKSSQIAARIKKSANNDAPAGGNKALLTLTDGTTIVLDTAANGQLANQGNISIMKLQNGQLKFTINDFNGSADTSSSQLNTVTTPRGGQYELELQDGTHIWLNAATSVSFPNHFSNGVRLVLLNGEAYFEVAKDVAHPFKVAVSNTSIDVTGTHFNVNAYSDEQAITTTLLEGKVQVKTGSNSIALLPGYQCKTLNGNNSINTHSDVEAATAWKNGHFQFAGADVKTIMRQISRWYNVDVNYVDDVPSAHITGEMPRTLTLRQVTNVLEESGINVWLEDDNQLYVAPAQ